ncbi:hypothetical protein [Arenibacter latericius]|uniref:hypothetical protein n=1 Tax=Arenibacter latericius TaxID=86104 RepID=UPI00042682DB|nr:hypothetical protein [Arenibacter latericius]MDX1364969.1 hypothetical protein [Arenibacter latericius]
MRNHLYLPVLLLILLASCGNPFTSTVSETIKINCTPANIDSNYEKIQPIISAIDREAVNSEIIENFPELKKSNYEIVTLGTSKVHKSFKMETSSNSSTSNDLYYVLVHISISHNKAATELAKQAVEFYKEYVKKELQKNNIDVG